MFEQVVGERDPSWLIAALRRRWWVIVFTAAIAAAAAYVLSSHQTKRYTATSALLFLNTPLDQELIAKQVVDNVDPARQAATNQSLVQLQTVSRTVAAQLRIPLTRVRNDVSFGSVASSDVLKVSVTDQSPIMAMRIANAYVYQYITFRKSAAISELQTAENVVTSRLAAAQNSGEPGVTSLIDDRNELDLLKGAQTGGAQVVQTATIPRTPSSPTPIKDGALGLLLGLLAGGALVAVLGRRDRHIKTVEEAEEIYGTHVVGTIPESSELRSGSVGGLREEEAFLMIRAQLRYFDVDRHLSRVMIASADAAEGKTMIALNLARAAARTNDKRVLLIEADLRRPTLHTMIGAAGAAGLAELLSHSQDVQDVETALLELVVPPGRVREREHLERLDILLAGSTPANPAELLESRHIRQLLEAADRIYDTVIIDTPPIGAVSDAIPLVHQVDGLLLISRMGISRRDHAGRLMKRLRDLNANILGVVVNSYRAPGDSDYGYYNYLSSGTDGAFKRSSLTGQRIARTR